MHPICQSQPYVCEVLKQKICENRCGKTGDTPASLDEPSPYAPCTFRSITAEMIFISCLKREFGKMHRKNLHLMHLVKQPKKHFSVLTPMNFEYVTQSSIFWPSNIVSRSLELVHFYGNMHWGPSLIFFTLVVRMGLVPFFIKQLRASSKSLQYKDLIQSMQMEAKKFREDGNIDAYRRKVDELQTFMREKDINPGKMLLYSFLPAPFLMASFFAIKNMSSLPVPSLQETFLWCPDLTVSDPFFIFPVIGTVALSWSIEVNQTH